MVEMGKVEVPVQKAAYDFSRSLPYGLAHRALTGNQAR